MAENIVQEQTNSPQDANTKLVLELQAELAQAKEDKRRMLCESYSKLCEAKKVKEKDTSKLSEETLKVLIEQISDLETPKPTPSLVKESSKPSFKSQLAENFNEEETNKFILEKNDYGKNSIWAMPNSKGRIEVKLW